MSGIGISPAVMINRMVHETAAPGNHLLQVARLRATVAEAAQHEQTKAELLQGETAPARPAIVTGADIDRLV